MADFILVTGDKANFPAIFGKATLLANPPGMLNGSGVATLKGQKICIDGDETKLSVPACPYITQQHTIPGIGTLKIKALAADQLAKKTHTSNGKKVLLKGKQFDAIFEVDKQAPAKQPPPGPGSPIPDTTPSYEAKGTFETMNDYFKGS
jgi:hypothetical protein